MMEFLFEIYYKYLNSYSKYAKMMPLRSRWFSGVPSLRRPLCGWLAAGSCVEELVSGSQLDTAALLVVDRCRMAKAVWRRRLSVWRLQRQSRAWHGQRFAVRQRWRWRVGQSFALLASVDKTERGGPSC